MSKTVRGIGGLLASVCFFSFVAGHTVFAQDASFDDAVVDETQVFEEAAIDPAEGTAVDIVVEGEEQPTVKVAEDLADPILEAEPVSASVRLDDQDYGDYTDEDLATEAAYLQVEVDDLQRLLDSDDLGDDAYDYYRQVYEYLYLNLDIVNDEIARRHVVAAPIIAETVVEQRDTPDVADSFLPIRITGINTI